MRGAGPIVRAFFCRGRRPVAASILVALAVCGLGCASTGTTGSLRNHDPFENFNRASYNVHDRLDKAMIRPMARAYNALPDKVQNRLSNFLDNLRGPNDVVNNLLQRKPKRGFSGIGRLLVNSTIGLGGLFDPASRMGMPRHEEDFGQTLAAWGSPSGPYIFLPWIGPSTARDLVGRVFDWQISPVSQHDDTSTRNILVVFDRIERRADYLGLAFEAGLERSDDPYNAVRSEYGTTRENQLCDCDRIDFLDFD